VDAARDGFAFERSRAGVDAAVPARLGVMRFASLPVRENRMVRFGATGFGTESTVKNCAPELLAMASRVPIVGLPDGFSSLAICCWDTLAFPASSRCVSPRSSRNHRIWIATASR